MKPSQTLSHDAGIVDPLVRAVRNLVRAEVRRAISALGADERVPHGRWGLPRRVACTLAATGGIPATKRGRSWYAKRADLDAFFAAQGQASEPNPVNELATMGEPLSDLAAMIDAATSRRRARR